MPTRAPTHSSFPTAKLLDYDSARSKARKLAEKPSDDATKLPRAEKEAEDARNVFEAFNEALSAELPQLVDLRIPYLDPSFESMVRLQLQFAETGYEKLGAVQRFFAESIRYATILLVKLLRD